MVQFSTQFNNLGIYCLIGFGLETQYKPLITPISLNYNGLPFNSLRTRDRSRFNGGGYSLARTRLSIIPVKWENTGKYSLVSSTVLPFAPFAIDLYAYIATQISSLVNLQGIIRDFTSISLVSMALGTTCQVSRNSRKAYATKNLPRCDFHLHR